MATVITIINYNHTAIMIVIYDQNDCTIINYNYTVIMIINYDRKTFIVQATDALYADNIFLFLHKQVILSRRSTVLSLPLQ